MKGGADSKNFSKLLDLPTEILDPEFENFDNEEKTKFVEIALEKFQKKKMQKGKRTKKKGEKDTKTN